MCAFVWLCIFAIQKMCLKSAMLVEDTFNAIMKEKVGTWAHLANNWYNLSSALDPISHFASIFDTWTTYRPTQEHLLWAHNALGTHRCSIHTSMNTHMCTHMADPVEVTVDLWLFGLLCYFNVCCCTRGDTQAITWQHDRGAQLPFPQEHVCAP